MKTNGILTSKSNLFIMKDIFLNQIISNIKANPANYNLSLQELKAYHFKSFTEFSCIHKNTYTKITKITKSSKFSLVNHHFHKKR